MESLKPQDALLIADVQNDFLPGGALGIRGGDEIPGDIDAKHVGARAGRGQCRGAVAATKVENPRADGDAQSGDQGLAALPHGPGDAGEITLLPQRLIEIDRFCRHCPVSFHVGVRLLP